MRRQTIHRSITAAASHPTNRAGSTMAEVLISVMILSIGVLSLSALFPLSLLRSVQANQLTNATILSMNAETLIDASIKFERDSLTGGEYWSNIANNPDGNTFATDGVAFLTEHYGQNYLVDPLGFSLSPTFNTLGSLTRFAGETRFDPGAAGTYAARYAAQQAVVLPDSWVLQFEDVAVSAAPPVTSVTLTEIPAATLQAVSTGNEDADEDGLLDTMPTSEDRNGNGQLDIAESRVVLIDDTGKNSQVRTITGISGQTISWSTAEPIGFTVATVRVETAELRFTWLLTVRTNTSGAPNVDVVVFFRRPEPLQNTTETIHSASTFTKGSRAAKINYAAANEPPLKKGGYVLDSLNARWYRVQQITKTASGADLTLEQPAAENSTEAVVMEGVVDVFPLGDKLPTDFR